MVRVTSMLMLLGVLTACQQEAPSESSAPAPAVSSAIAYTNANIWDGTGSPLLRNATLVVDGGRVAAVSNDDVPEGATIVDLNGAYVIPGLINTHGHVTSSWAPASVLEPQSRVLEGLRLYARYGVTTVLSLGGAPDEAFALRQSFNPEDPGHARFYLAGPVVADRTAADARAQAMANVERGVDWLKLRVDDNLGRADKMPWEAVEAVFDVSRETDVPVATHIFYQSDAARLIDLGSAMIAHSVRDLPVDDAFISSLDMAGVCYVPTLTREVSTFVYAETPGFFDDPFFQRHANAEQLARVSDPEFQSAMASSEAAAGYRVALRQAMENLGRMTDTGAAIAFGTDSGPPGRFPGYFEHLELEMMVEAGMTPEQALMSATGEAADCVGLTEVGTLEPGKWADFLVLEDDPTVDISATKSLQRVFLAGRELR